MASYDVASTICHTLGRGVTRSKRLTMSWLRKAAEHGIAASCLQLAARMYSDRPYAREVGHAGEAAGVATSTGLTEGHDVPPDVLTDVVHWLRKGGCNTFNELDGFRKLALEGGAYCRNDGCVVMGHLKDFKVCPQCKDTPYCSDACQKQDWTAGGHRETCGNFSETCGKFSGAR